METPDSVTDSNVEEALSAVLSDDKFAAAPQMSAFLKYVVTQTLYEDPTRIKAYTVAVDALGKPPTFDPQNDPSVRVLAKRLRGSLDTYYENNPDIDIIIEMKAGSYVPHFVRRAAANVAEEPPPTVVVPGAQAIPATQSNKYPDSVRPSSAAALKLARATTSQHHADNLHASVAAKPADPQPSVQTSVQTSVQHDKARMESSSPSGMASENPASIAESASAQIAVPALLHNRASDDLSAATNTVDQIQVSDTNVTDHSAVNPIETNQGTSATPQATNGLQRKEPSILDRLTAIPRSAIAMGLCAGLLWFVMAGEQEPDKEELAEAQLGAAMPTKDGTGDSASQPEFRPRPDKLTIVGVNLSADTVLGRSIVDTVSTVVSRFDQVDLYRQQDRVVGSQRWPEDYQIHLQVAALSDRSEINVQLIHAKSSRIAYSETLTLQSAVNSELSDADYIRVQHAAARWMQSDGPILRDYHSNASSRTKEMACYIGVIAVGLHTDLRPAHDYRCDSLTDESESGTATAMVYRAWKMLTDDAHGEPSVSVADHDLTLETAAKAVEQSPYNGYAHMTLAMAQNLVGDVDGSERSVENAMMLNPLDANFLNRSASISEHNGHAEQAAQWRTKAAQLSSVADL